jgi:RNA polymerase sigma-70 factor (ECF subfamily)
VASSDFSGVLAPPAERRYAEALEFTDVFRQHFDFVWRALRSFGVAEAGLDDAVQDVFISVHRRLPDFEARSSLRTWIYSIAYHTAQNHRRGAQRREAFQSLDPDLPSVDPTPGDRAATAQAGRFVLDFLDRLPRERRDVFVLCVLEELSAPDVADILQIKINTVYSRLRLARADFRQALQHFAANGDGRHEPR